MTAYPYSKTSGAELDFGDLWIDDFPGAYTVNVPKVPRLALTFRSLAQELAAEVKLTAKIQRDPLCGHWPFKLNPGEAPGLSAAAWLQPPKAKNAKRTTCKSKARGRAVLDLKRAKQSTKRQPTRQAAAA